MGVAGRYVVERKRFGLGDAPEVGRAGAERLVDPRSGDGGGDGFAAVGPFHLELALGGTLSSVTESTSSQPSPDASFPAVRSKVQLAYGFPPRDRSPRGRRRSAGSRATSPDVDAALLPPG